jgi:hypothetical protein
MRRVLAILSLCLAAAAGAREPGEPGAPGEPVVVVNARVTQNWVSLNRLRAIFGMRQRKWDDGSLIRVFVLDSGAELHQRFCTDTLRVLPHQLDRAWGRLVFSGTGQAPHRLTSTEQLLERVAATPGAVGYFDPGGGGAAVPPGVRRLPLRQ